MATSAIYVEGGPVLPQARTTTTIDWVYVEGQLGGLAAPQPTGAAQVDASAAETLTATDQATVALLAALVTATASETVTVADAALSAALTVLVDLSQAEAITVEDAALQAVGILVSAAEWSGEDTPTSSNW